MVLRTDIRGDESEFGWHAAQHNEVNTDVLALQAASGTGLVPQPARTSAFTAVAGNTYPLDTSTATFAMALPGSPTNGQAVGATWYAGPTAPTVTGTINGASGFTFATDETVVFQWNSSLSSWVKG